MRILSILGAGIVAFSLLAAPARADSEDGNNTSETVFAIIDLGGFFGDGSSDQQFFSTDYETPNILIVNLASVNGDIHEFLGLTFNTVKLGDVLGDDNTLTYFILGHITGSDHLILSNGEGEPGPLPDDFETPIIEGIRNMDNLGAGQLGAPGGALAVTPGDFMGQLGVGIDEFTNPTNIPFDPLSGGETDLLGFTDPVFLTRMTLVLKDGVLVGMQVPEPGLALLAIAGIAGAVIARRRRNAA